MLGTSPLVTGAQEFLVPMWGLPTSPGQLPQRQLHPQVLPWVMAFLTLGCGAPGPTSASSGCPVQACFRPGAAEDSQASQSRSVLVASFSACVGSVFYVRPRFRRCLLTPSIPLWGSYQASSPRPARSGRHRRLLLRLPYSSCLLHLFPACFRLF